MTITSIQASNETLACAKAFNRFWQRFTGEVLPLQGEQGDLVLQLDPTVPQDQILITAAADTITVTAENESALFKGTMMVLQRLLGKVAVISKTITLSPQKKLLMVDMGRKFFPLTTLKELVDSLAIFNFDQLQLHFSENEGFRIESERYPWLASAEHLTKAEVRELIQYAHGQHIEIIPDFDSPGHLKHVLADKPEWRLDKLAEDGTLVKDEKALDILNPEAVAFIWSIYEEYAQLFVDCRYFHVGADEFVPFDDLHNYPTLAKHAAEKYGPEASGIEVFIEYVNKTVAYVRQLGFIPLVWNDGFYRVNRTEGLHLTKDCMISYWTRWNKNMAPIQTFIDLGYTVINHNDNYFYYVLGEHASYTYPTYEKIMTGWTPVDFPQQQVINEDQLTSIAANAIAIWSDIPDALTPAEVVENVFYLMAALMQKADQRLLGDQDVIRNIYQGLLQ